MTRVLAFALHAHEALSFGRGIGTEDRTGPVADLTGLIEWWIEVGLRMNGCCARPVVEPNRCASIPMAGLAGERLNNLTVMNLSPEGSRALAGSQRQMEFQDPRRAGVDRRWDTSGPDRIGDLESGG